MMGFAVIVGAAITDPTILDDSLLNLMYGFTTGFMLTAASMSINDYNDRVIDAVNEPNRPIPSGLIKPREALAIAVILTAIGFTAASLTNVFCFVIAIFASIVSVSYTTFGKRSGLPGNLLVGAFGVIPFLYGNYVVASTIDLKIVIFASMAFLSITGREITKGIVDVEGDKTQNVKTLAVRFGEKNAAIAATVFYLIAVSLSPIPWLLGLVSVFFIPLVATTDLGLLASSLMLLRDHSRGNARRIKKTVLFLLLIGLLAFFVGTFR
jgi:geranylgeranylglycerol-phosphate geranylgeranyltransferase